MLKLCRASEWRIVCFMFTFLKISRNQITAMAVITFLLLKNKKPGIILYKQIPGFFIGAEDRGRTGTEYYLRGILSPVRLPIPPLRQIACISLQRLIPSVKRQYCFHHQAFSNARFI